MDLNYILSIIQDASRGLTLKLLRPEDLLVILDDWKGTRLQFIRSLL